MRATKTGLWFGAIAVLAAIAAIAELVVDPPSAAFPEPHAATTPPARKGPTSGPTGRALPVPGVTPLDPSSAPQDTSVATGPTHAQSTRVGPRADSGPPIRMPRERPEPRRRPGGDVHGQTAAGTNGSTTINPLHEGVVLESVGWSPDSRWFAFWDAGSYTPHDWRQGDSALRWIDVSAGVVCEQPSIRRVGPSDDVFWSEQGELVVRIDGKASYGRPCQPLEPKPESTFALPVPPPGVTPEWAMPMLGDGFDAPGPEDTAVSPDGRFQITTTASGENRFISRMSDSSGSTVAEVSWKGNGGLGDMGTGGSWLPTGEFLIGSSVDQGPLLVGTDGSVTDVPNEFFHLSPSDDERRRLYAFVHIPGHAPWLGTPPSPTDPWHLFLTGADQVRLFHPENGQVETLPSDSLWYPPVTPDNEWLMLEGRTGTVDGLGDALWIRRLERSDTDFRRIDAGLIEGNMEANPSPDWSHLAITYWREGSFNDAHEVLVTDFPSGRLVGKWRLSDHGAAIIQWSPDGATFVVLGLFQTEDERAEGVYLVVPTRNTVTHRDA